MTYLLDTHVILWAAVEPAKLSQKVTALLNDTENKLVMSAASAWEISVKVSIGKLLLPMNLEAFIHTTVAGLGALVINITLDDILQLNSLSMKHKDPFDRILIAQSAIRQLPLITADRLIRQYDIETVWN